MPLQNANYNQKSNRPAFKGQICLEIQNLADNTRLNLIKAVKKEIGDGLVNMKYNHDGENIFQQVFVGFNPANIKNKDDKIGKIIIATGNDLDLLSQKGENFSQRKILRIDKKITEILSEIFRLNGINRSIMEVKIGNMGDISTEEKFAKIGIETNKGKKLHVYKQRALSYEYAKTESV